VKRILRKYGYPPDLHDAAIQVILQQAEALSAQWAACAKHGPQVYFAARLFRTKIRWNLHVPPLKDRNPLT
jgi:hypothetical protein